MKSLTETRKSAPGRGRGRDPIAGLDIAATGTIILIVLTALTLLTTALTVHNRLVTAGAAVLAVVICVFILWWFIKRATDPVRSFQKKMTDLAQKIEAAPSGLAVLLQRDNNSAQSLKELETFLEEDDRLSVVRLKGNDIPQAKLLLNDLEQRLGEDERRSVVRLDRKHILEAPPGVQENLMPYSLECQKIVGMIGWALEEAPGLNDDGKEAVAELRRVVRFYMQESDALEQLREYAVRMVRESEDLRDRIVLLAYARPEALERPAGKWMLDLLHDLGCTFGVLTQEDQGSVTVGPIVLPEIGRRYAVGRLILWMGEPEVRSIFPALSNAVRDPRGLDIGLLELRCAVLAAATPLGKQTEAIERLPAPDSPVPGDLARAATLEVRWLVDCKAARAGVLDRLAVIGKVTSKMLAVLLRDLQLDAEGASNLFDWLRGDEFRPGEMIVSTEEILSSDGSVRTEATISLGEVIRNPILKWLGEHEQSAIRQQAQLASERCYRDFLMLDPAHLPGSGYSDWVKPEYDGLTFFENPDWLDNVYAWAAHVAEIISSEDRRDARVAITCIFLEAWWWWGDQLSHPFAAKALELARLILHDQPEWIGALEEFNDNYEPAFDRRAAAADRWRHVANSLDFLASSLDLRQGDIPADRVLKRIYICWCFSHGDAAQHTGDLEAADRWFRQAGEACDDDEAGLAKRAFASYQRADVWIPSNTDRSMRLITDTSLAQAAVDLEDLSLQAYVARMYGDIRWKSGRFDGAFGAYGRALLLAYVYQVDQEQAIMPPSDYTRALYNEMRTRFLARLDEVRQKGLESAANAAVERITKLFGPYWTLERAAIAPGNDGLANIAPPLPGREDLKLDSSYMKDALKVKEKLLEQVANPIDQPLPKS